MRRSRTFSGLTAIAALAVGAANASADTPTTVVSIKPIHSLVSGVMDQVGDPILLLPAGASPHAYALRPSDARHLRDADLIVWVGEGLETFLQKPLRVRVGKAQIVTLVGDAGLDLLTVRKGPVWDRHQHTIARTNEKRDARGGPTRNVEPHVWLDPRNAARIVGHVAAVLAKLDEPNAARYAANARRLKRRLAALDIEIRDIIAPVSAAPYVVFHDAYQYFERRYAIQPIGAITINPERKPGARRLAAIRRKIAEVGAQCVFSEPQFRPSVIRAVIRGTGARTGILDPLGIGTPDGIDGYVALLRGFAQSLRSCLSPPA